MSRPSAFTILYFYEVYLSLISVKFVSSAHLSIRSSMLHLLQVVDVAKPVLKKQGGGCWKHIFLRRVRLVRIMYQLRLLVTQKFAVLHRGIKMWLLAKLLTHTPSPRHHTLPPCPEAQTC